MLQLRIAEGLKERKIAGSVQLAMNDGSKVSKVFKVSKTSQLSTLFIVLYEFFLGKLRVIFRRR